MVNGSRQPQIFLQNQAVMRIPARPMASAIVDICDSKPKRMTSARPIRSALLSFFQQKPKSQRPSTDKGSRRSGINWLVYQEMLVKNPKPAQIRAVASGPAGNPWQRSRR